PLDDRDDLWDSLEMLEQRLGLRTEADDGELLVHVAPAPRVAGDLAAERLRDPLEQSPGTVEQHSPPWPWPLLALERRHQLRLRLRPDSGHAGQVEQRRERLEPVCDLRIRCAILVSHRE